MRIRESVSRFPPPFGDMLLFAVTLGGYLALWRVFMGPVDGGVLAGAVGCAVALGWWDIYRRERRRAEADRAAVHSSSTSRGGTPPA